MRQGDCIEMTEKSIELTEWDITLMAWHEAGHAVCAYYLPETEAIQSISIEPGNEAFGMMKSEPRKKLNLTYVSCLNEISVALAGRLSEEIFQNDITSSCIHDLDKVQSIALRMVCELGMGSRTGKITWMCRDKESESLMLFSEAQRNDIYADIKEILCDAEKEARDLLESKAEQVRTIAEILMKQKTISGKELFNVLKHPVSQKGREQHVSKCTAKGK